ncbi:LON peptidase substrate-binding domain-containing protein [Noviherbaspirillum massiliense]|uniref:LON peptidase substrate-binding domain-containing protein n=1 Tax=Noviherbaspirillum massiliense TaxID=1465823 RepID=UPI0003747A19|nr:LON peptidase substrate-binding domain-containing protein [Noviherbaspirillum massiliense]
MATTTTSLPLFPLNTVLFPGGYLPLQVFEVRYLDMINKCIADGTQFGVVALTEGSEVRQPGVTESFADVGTMAKIDAWQAPMPGLLQIACSGSARFRIASSMQLRHGLWMAETTAIEDDVVIPVPAELQNTVDVLEKLLDSLQKEGMQPHEMPVIPPFQLDDCGWVANRWAELLPMPLAQKLRLLELDNPMLRLELIQDLLAERGL